mgnify:CR=1 FL=1
MEIQISSSNHDVLESGTVVTYNKENEVLFSIKMDATFSFDLMLKFTSNGEKQHQLQQNISNNTITLNCVNFDSILGTGTRNPIELATFRDKKVYINFWVNPLGDNALKK